jgi:serine/threonine protein kinase
MTVLAEIAPGTCIGDRYRIENILGQGGFGRTYLVCDQQHLGTLCVLKEFFPARTEGSLLQRSLELFQREAKVLQRLNHPQIPKFVNWFEDEGRLCIIQEYIDGKTYWQLLRERLEKGEVFSEAEILQWLKDLLPILDYLHTSYVIHRDISPDNIILSKKTGKPFLIDLGIVKEAATQGYYSYVTTGGTLGSVSLVGKRGYSPPEQMLMGQCYPNSDLYSLAVTALVLLTGRPPTDLFDSHGMEWNWQNYVELSDPVTEIFSKMLAEKPKERYRSAKEILDILPVAIPEMVDLKELLDDFATEQPTELFLSETTSTSEITPLQDKVVYQDKTNHNSLQKLKTKGLLAASAFLSTIVVGFQSPHLPFLCKTLDNCARDKQYQALYQQHLEQGKTAIAIADKAKSVEELQNARDRLNTSLTNLKTIPNDVKVAPQAQQTLQNYQSQFKRIDTEVSQEQQAEQQLKQVETSLKQATQATATAKTIKEQQQAKALWNKAQQQLKAIPKDVLIASQVQAKINDSTAKAKDLQTKIDRQIKLAQIQQLAKQRAAQVSRTSSSSTRVRSSSAPVTPRVTRTSSSYNRSNRYSTPKRVKVTPRRVPSSVRRAPSKTPLWGKSAPQHSSGRKPLW